MTQQRRRKVDKCDDTIGKGETKQRDETLC